jgi:RNA polymerase primary sigma factor
MLRFVSTFGRTAAAASARRRATPRGGDLGDVVSLYLADVGSHPLLSGDEEVSLAQAIEAGRAARDALQRAEAVGKGGRAELCRLAEAGERARATFIAANLRLVVSVARGYARAGAPLADLVQEGNIGLMAAVERFDWRRGWRFSTYASWWVRQAVLRAIDASGRSVHVPAHVSERAWRVS